MTSSFRLNNRIDGLAMGLWPKPTPTEGTAGTPYAAASIRAMKPPTIHYEAILYLIGGDVIAGSLAHVAAYFSVGLQTVKNWRQMGMPGTSGGYPVLDVLVWRLKEDARGEHRDVEEFSCSHCDAERARLRVANRITHIN